MAPVRTLIVDDHAGARFLIRAVIADAGVDVEVVGEAASVDAALALVDELAPDVVVLDARLPRVDGFEAAPLFVGRGVAVVMCSALVDEPVRARASAAGAVGVVSKDRLDALPGAVLRAAGRL
jgi:DNA-binding NarL/FixJ family response regulator